MRYIAISMLAVALASCSTFAENYRRVKAQDAAAQVAADAELCRGYGFTSQDATATCVARQAELRQAQVDRIGDDFMGRRR